MKYKDTTIFIFLLSVCFIGIAVGMIVARNKQIDVSTLAESISGIKSEELSLKKVFTKSILTNLYIFIFLNMMGALVFGFPVSTLLLFYKSYAVGFSCGCVALAMGFKGIAAAVIGVLLPSCIILTLLSHMVYKFWDDSGRSKIKAYKRYKSRLGNGVIYFLLFGLCVFTQSVIQYVVFHKFL